jgi:outer membrane protein assembly factor BamA
MRGYEYREFLGHKGFYANAELRFPLIHAMATPIGILGGIRGVFFANLGGTGFEGRPFKVWDKSTFITDEIRDQNNILIRPRQRIEGFRLADARASYGIGLETFALGFPVHFDWSYRTLFNKAWEDYNYGSSVEFRKPRFTAWIGYDF